MFKHQSTFSSIDFLINQFSYQSTFSSINFFLILHLLDFSSPLSRLLRLLVLFIHYSLLSRILVQVLSKRRSLLAIFSSVCSPPWPVPLTSGSWRTRPRKPWRFLVVTRPRLATTSRSSHKLRPCWHRSSPRSRRQKQSGGWSWRWPTSKFFIKNFFTVS